MIPFIIFCQSIADLIVKFLLFNDFKNSSIYPNLNEINSESELSLRNLILRFLFYILTSAKHVVVDEIFFHESKEIILKLLKQDTEATQKAIKEIKLKDDLNLSFLAELCFKNLLSIIFNQYNPTTIEITDDYYVSCRIIKVFKFLCEEHNNFFQQILLNELQFRIDKTETAYFYEMMIFILDKIIVLSGWDKFRGNEEDEEGVDFFYALFTCIVEMLIEIIQGTEEKNFINLLKKETAINLIHQNTNFKNSTIIGGSIKNISEFVKIDPTLEKGTALPLLFKNIKNLLFNDYANSNTIFKARTWLVNFLLAFMEEEACPIFIKNLIMSSYHPHSILKSICFALKFYYLNNIKKNINTTIKENPTPQRSSKTMTKFSSDLRMMTNRKTQLRLENHLKTEKQKKDKSLKNIKFNEKLYKYFTDLYLKDEDFVKSPHFEFCSVFYNYFKITLIDHKYEEAINYWKKNNSITQEQLNLFNLNSQDEEEYNKPSKIKDNETILEKEIYYVIKLFEQVSKSVTIKFPENPKPVLIVHSLTPKLYYLSYNSKEEFMRNVNRETRHSKLHSLMEQTIYFAYEIEYNWKYLRNNKLLRKIMEIDYKLVGKIIWFFNAVINIFFLSVLQNSGRSSLGGNYTKVIVMSLFICETIINGLFIILWCMTKLPLIYKIENQRYIERLEILGKKSHELGMLHKFNILINKAILSKEEINSLLWLFIFNVLSLIDDNLFFLHSVSLFSIMFISQTLKNIALSIILKKEQLAWTAIFTFIILYIYSSWAYFYVQHRFIDVHLLKVS